VAKRRLSPGLSEDPVLTAWASYCRTVDTMAAGFSERESLEAKARWFMESLKRFMHAADFLEVSTARRSRCLGISHRTYFYWLCALKEGKGLRYQIRIDYKLWLVWKSLELARLKFLTDDLAATWFSTPNGLLSQSGQNPTSLLFNHDVRRRPRVLRSLM
jgi:hypothetical protein